MWCLDSVCSCEGPDVLRMQILFPASYSETAAWLRKAAISNEGTLRQCISQLQAALGADAHLQTLTAGVQVCLTSPEVTSTMLLRHLFPPRSLQTLLTL